MTTEQDMLVGGQRPEELAAAQIRREMFQKAVSDLVTPALADHANRLDALRLHVVRLEFEHETMRRALDIMLDAADEEARDLVKDLMVRRRERMRLESLPQKPLLVNRATGQPLLDDLGKPVMAGAIDETDLGVAVTMLVPAWHPLHHLDGEVFRGGRKKLGEVLQAVNRRIEEELGKLQEPEEGE